ncbi:9530_t:CDS:2, partial [Cetraspora pellucida]
HASSEQHKDAIRLDVTEKIVNKELEQFTEQNKNHMIEIAKISLFIVDNVVIYENKISGHEFAFAISNHIDIYVMYLNISGNVKTYFLQLLVLDQSNAVTITTKLIQLFQSYNIINKLVAFASDDASIIIGCKNGYLISLNKIFQKSNLYFQDIISIIDATTKIIQKDYLVDILDVQNHYLGYNLQLFINYTNPFNKQTDINYYTHLLIYNNHDFDDLFQDIYKYTSTIITEIKEHFPDHLLLAAMRILNSVK